MAEPMKIRAQMQGDVAEVKVLMNHPMETGNRKDERTGQTIPAHFIQQVTATYNGAVVYEAQLSQAVAKNPFLSFRIRNARPGDKVAVSWQDNTGDHNSIETTISGN